jgi:hypothetical protein
MSHRDYLLSLEHLGIKLGLAQIRALVAALGHPDRAFRSVVVAGTNGKGSVTAMIERGLRAAGVATGRFTSPHLVTLNERFSDARVGAERVGPGPMADDGVVARADHVVARLEVPPHGRPEAPHRQVAGRHELDERGPWSVVGTPLFFSVPSIHPDRSR